jgi:hypothetical protein
MEPDPALNDAIQTAIDKTARAEREVVEVLETHQIPPVPIVEKVERRAEDLHVLAHQAAEEADT